MEISLPTASKGQGLTSISDSSLKSSRNGYQLFKTQNFEVKGLYQQGELQGACTLLDLKNNSIKKGQFNLNFQQDGFGIEQTSESSDYSYFGWFKAGAKMGPCIEQTPQSKYIGSVHNGKYNQLGKLINFNNFSILAEWSYGQKEGTAEIVSQNGDRFLGFFRNDIKDGIGYQSVAKFQTEYLGDFERNCKNGFGRQETPSVIYIGGWEADSYSGQGYFGTKQGSDFYLGQWQSGVQDGIGISQKGDTQYRGEWRGGVPHGIGYYINEAKRSRRVLYSWGDEEQGDFSKEQIDRFPILDSQLRRLQLHPFLVESKQKLNVIEKQLQENKNRILKYDVELVESRIKDQLLDLMTRIHEMEKALSLEIMKDTIRENEHKSKNLKKKRKTQKKATSSKRNSRVIKSVKLNNNKKKNFWHDYILPEVKAVPGLSNEEQGRFEDQLFRLQATKDIVEDKLFSLRKRQKKSSHSQACLQKMEYRYQTLEIDHVKEIEGLEKELGESQKKKRSILGNSLSFEQSFQQNSDLFKERETKIEEVDLQIEKYYSEIVKKEKVQFHHSLLDSTIPLELPKDQQKFLKMKLNIQQVEQLRTKKIVRTNQLQHEIDTCIRQAQEIEDNMKASHQPLNSGNPVSQSNEKIKMLENQVKSRELQDSLYAIEHQEKAAFQKIREGNKQIEEVEQDILVQKAKVSENEEVKRQLSSQISRLQYSKKLARTQHIRQQNYKKNLEQQVQKESGPNPGSVLIYNTKLINEKVSTNILEKELESQQQDLKKDKKYFDDVRSNWERSNTSSSKGSSGPQGRYQRMEINKIKEKIKKLKIKNESLSEQLFDLNSDKEKYNVPIKMKMKQIKAAENQLRVKMSMQKVIDSSITIEKDKLGKMYHNSNFIANNLKVLIKNELQEDSKQEFLSKQPQINLITPKNSKNKAKAIAVKGKSPKTNRKIGLKGVVLMCFKKNQFSDRRLKEFLSEQPDQFEKLVQEGITLDERLSIINNMLKSYVGKESSLEEDFDMLTEKMSDLNNTVKNLDKAKVIGYEKITNYIKDHHNQNNAKTSVSGMSKPQKEKIRSLQLISHQEVLLDDLKTTYEIARKNYKDQLSGRVASATSNQPSKMSLRRSNTVLAFNRRKVLNSLSEPFVKGKFFKNYELKKLKSKRPSETKFTLSGQGQVLYSFGPRSLSLQNMETDEEFYFSQQIQALDMKVGVNNKVFLINSQRNCLQVYSSELEKTVEIEGEPCGLQLSRLSSRSFGVDPNCYWIKNDNTLLIINTLTDKIHETYAFWNSYEDKKLTPLVVVSDKAMTKMGCLLVEKQRQEQIMMFIDVTSEKTNSRMVEPLLPDGAQFWAMALELDHSGDLLFMGGTNRHKKAIILASNFKLELSIVQHLELAGDDLRGVSSLSRIIGTDVLILGCVDNIVIVNYDATIAEFDQLRSINIGCEKSVQVNQFYGDSIYFTYPGAKTLQKLQFFQEVTMDAYIKNEYEDVEMALADDQFNIEALMRKYGQMKKQKFDREGSKMIKMDDFFDEEDYLISGLKSSELTVIKDKMIEGGVKICKNPSTQGYILVSKKGRIGMVASPKISNIILSDFKIGPSIGTIQYSKKYTFIQKTQPSNVVEVLDQASGNMVTEFYASELQDISLLEMGVYHKFGIVYYISSITSIERIDLRNFENVNQPFEGLSSHPHHSTIIGDIVTIVTLNHCNMLGLLVMFDDNMICLKVFNIDSLELQDYYLFDSEVEKITAVCDDDRNSIYMADNKGNLNLFFCYIKQILRWVVPNTCRQDFTFDGWDQL